MGFKRHFADISATGISGRRRATHSAWRFGIRLCRDAFFLLLILLLFFLSSRQAYSQFTDLPTVESGDSTTKTPLQSKKSKQQSDNKSFVPAPKNSNRTNSNGTVKPALGKPTAKQADVKKSGIVKPIKTDSQFTSQKPSSQESFGEVFQIPSPKTQLNGTQLNGTQQNGTGREKKTLDFASPFTPKPATQGTQPTKTSENDQFNNERSVQPSLIKPVSSSSWKPAEGKPSPEATNSIGFGSATQNPTATVKLVKRQDNAYRPWWREQLAKQTTGKQQGVVQEVSVDQLIMAMLQYSPEIRAIQQEPAIASTYVDVENAKFDPVSFLETKWEDTNEPVGNILTTNNSPFLKDHIITSKGGFRKRSQIGTELELAQNLGFKNSNSEFFIPQDQGTARLVLNIDQPLLNGAGRMVGTSRILVAEIDTGISESQYAEKLQKKILAVIRAYWDFYYQKSVLILRTQNYEAAVEVLRLLKGRESFDAQRSQIIRAEAAVAARKLDLIRSRTDVRNAATVLRELTRDPRLGKLGIANAVELIPTEFPNVDDSIYPELPPIVSVAFHNRPEIDQAMGRIRAASIQHDVSKNQLLPQLNFIFNVYAAALNGETGILRAWNRQFIDTTPGYSAGIVLEYPIYNRAALARKRRIEAQLTKLSSELDDTLGSISAEVEIAHRELKLALEATAESQKSIEAAERDEAFIQKRWKNFAFLQNPDFASPTIFLEQLLDAQDRITQAQVQYANASRQFMVAVAEVRKAEGSLLNYEQMVPVETPNAQNNLPEFAPQTEPNRN